jgi:serine/threonine protein kinase
VQSDPAPLELIGRRLGNKYLIRSLLAEGGMGVVFEAVHEDINRRVALKVLYPDLLDVEGSQRFLNEARAVNEARHRNIVQVSDFGTDQRWTYLVMEYLEGATLREWRAALPDAPASMILRATLPIGRALAFAHDRGFVHRDVKPENILLAREEGASEPTPKLLDFGVATFRNHRERLTRTGATLGTPMYMAPEQIGASRDVGPEADQYAFACVLYECIANAPPFVAKSLPMLAIAKATTDPPSLIHARPELSRALADVIARALSRDPEARWPSMGALCDALEPFAAADPVPWVPAPVRGRQGSAEAATIDAPKPIDANVLSSSDAAFAPTDLPPKLGDTTPPSAELEPDPPGRVAQLDLPPSVPPRGAGPEDETQKMRVARVIPSAIESTMTRDEEASRAARTRRGGVWIVVVALATALLIALALRARG